MLGSDKLESALARLPRFPNRKNFSFFPVENPKGDPTRNEIIDIYIKTLAQIVGGRCYYE